MLLLPSTVLVLALVIGWEARVTALRDDTAVLRRDCPDYESYSKARQSVSFLFFMIPEHHVEQRLGLTWLLYLPVPHTAMVF